MATRRVKCSSTAMKDVLRFAIKTGRIRSMIRDLILIFNAQGAGHIWVSLFLLDLLINVILKG